MKRSLDDAPEPGSEYVGVGESWDTQELILFYIMCKIGLEGRRENNRENRSGLLYYKRGLCLCCKMYANLYLFLFF